MAPEAPEPAANELPRAAAAELSGEPWVRRRSRLIALVVVFVVAHSVAYHESHFGNDMTKAILDMSCALVESGSVSIDAVHKNSNDIAYYDGRYYSGMAPGLSVLSVPLYAIAKGSLAVMPASSRQRLADFYYARRTHATATTPYDIELLIAAVLATAVFGFGFHLLFLLAVHRTLMKFAPAWAARTRLFLFLLLASAYLYYFGEFSTQGAALAMLGLGAYYGFVRRRDWSTPLVAGLLWGLAGSFDYPYLLFGGLGAAGLFFTSVRRNWPVAAGFGLVVVGLAAFHVLVFGHPLRTPYAFRATTEMHTHGVYGVAVPSLTRIIGYLIGPPDGLLLCAPVFAVVPVAIRRLRGQWRTVPRPLIVMGVVALASLLYGVCVPWGSGNIAFGPRFVLPAVVGLTLVAGTVGSRWVYGLAFLTFLIGHVNQSLQLGGLRPYVFLQELFRSSAPRWSVEPSGLAFKLLPGFAELPAAILLELVFILGAAWLFRSQRALAAKLESTDQGIG